MIDGLQRITVADGRSLELWSTPGTTGRGVLLHMGTPSAGLPLESAVTAVVARDARFVTYSRPGYAGSTRHEGRSVSSCADDVRSIAAALGLDELHVIGWSGGGPHALACGALLPDLVRSVATLAGVAPWGAEGLDWLDGMAAENVEEFGAAIAGPDELRRFLEPFADALARVTGETVAEMLGGLVTDVDRAALDGAFAEYQASVLRAAVSSGIWGWFDDDVAFTRPWGFEPSSIAVPVTVWQGRQDAMVPFGHGAWLAASIPGAQGRLLDDEGHLSLVARFAEIVDDLLAT